MSEIRAAQLGKWEQPEGFRLTIHQSLLNPDYLAH